MATRIARSSGFMVLLVTLVAGVRALPVEKLVEIPSSGLRGAEPPFDAAQYKEYLTNLKCKELNILHEGVKIPEIATGTIYEPTTTPEPLPPLQSPPPTGASPTKEQPASALLTTNVPTTEATRKVPSESKDKIPEYEDDVDKNEKYPSESSTTEESVLLSGGNNGTEECTAPLSAGWDNYNWYQVLVDNGGPPGGYLQKGLKSNLTKALDPCSRPVLQLPPAVSDTSFTFTHSEFEKVYRSEQVQVRFPGTPLEFLDVSGKLIWSPPGFKRRYFHFSYRKDDTGLYINLDRHQRCVFISDTYVRVECDYSELACDCLNGKESCFSLPVPAAGVPAGLAASLVGGGR